MPAADKRRGDPVHSVTLRPADGSADGLAVGAGICSEHKHKHKQNIVLFVPGATVTMPNALDELKAQPAAVPLSRAFART